MHKLADELREKYSVIGTLILLIFHNNAWGEFPLTGEFGDYWKKYNIWTLWSYVVF